jgi:hypothetical protein
MNVFSQMNNQAQIQTSLRFKLTSETEYGNRLNGVFAKVFVNVISDEKIVLIVDNACLLH